MEAETAIKPKLSVIVPAMQGYNTVLAALDSWEAQSCRYQLEILVLCPDAEAAIPRAGQVLIETGSMRLHEARAAGILRASADYVMVAEDHCLPDIGWAQVVLERLAEGWDAVGPALRSGNPARKVSQASFLLGYGQWMNPESGGTVSVLPGHNAVLRKKVLLELGPALERELLVAAFLLKRLHVAGQRFYLDAQATMRHFDKPGWKKEIRTFYCVGLGFGSIRTSHWSWAGRALYCLAAPAIAARHWWRAFTQYRRAGARAGLSPWCLAAASVLASVWACGEAAGALAGVERVTLLVSSSEIKPVSRSEVLSEARSLSRDV